MQTSHFYKLASWVPFERFRLETWSEWGLRTALRKRKWTVLNTVWFKSVLKGIVPDWNFKVTVVSHNEMHYYLVNTCLSLTHKGNRTKKIDLSPQQSKKNMLSKEHYIEIINTGMRFVIGTTMQRCQQMFYYFFKFWMRHQCLQHLSITAAVN